MGRKGKLFALFVAAAATPAAAATNLITNGDFTDLTNNTGQITNKTGGPASTGTTSAVGWDTTGYNMVMTNANTGVPTQYSDLFYLWDKANGGASNWDGATASGSGNFLAMDGDFNTAAVTQTLTGLIVGQTYSFSFNYAFAQQRKPDGSGFDGTVYADLTAKISSDVVGQPDSVNVLLPTGGFFNCTNQGATCDGGYGIVPEHSFSGWNTFTTTFKANATTEVLSFLADGSRQVPPFSLVSDVSLYTVPEPSTWAMMMLGFAGLGYAGLRSARRKAAAA